MVLMIRSSPGATTLLDGLSSSGKAGEISDKLRKRASLVRPPPMMASCDALRRTPAAGLLCMPLNKLHGATIAAFSRMRKVPKPKAELPPTIASFICRVDQKHEIAI
ncbi:MAG: hypothetical protein M4579_006298 [Chaenotheca gracillima]|nr:MAG: hypothetical protein M4579_006298 [Chaenotheca gracillima]